MATDSNLQFIREKIYALRSAIMYSMSTELVKIPNNVITAIRVDEEGQLWFLSKRPMQLVSECEQVFPVHLKFYRKGVEFYLEVSGNAMIMNAQVLPEWLFRSAENIYDRKINPVLIKMNMANVEYFEPTTYRQHPAGHLLKSISNWFSKNTTLHRPPKSVISHLHQSH